MKIVQHYPDGMFSWVDLNTTDLAAAQRFYAALFGWEVDERPIDTGRSYTQFRIDGYSVAGGGQLPAEMIAAGAPPVWTSYVNHRDIDGVAARIGEAGGVVFVPPMDVMDQGRFALAQDPTGAPFGLWQPWAHIGAQVVNQPNSLVWTELLTHDTAAARAFYEKVFGWTEHVEDSGYILWHDEGRVHCGGLAMSERMSGTPSHWMPYFLVEDVPASAARVVELGGTVPVGPKSAGEMSEFIIAADPQGARFGAIRFKVPVDAPPGTD